MIRKIPDRYVKGRKMVQNFKFVAHPCSRHLAIIAISSGPLSCLDMPPVDSFWTGRLTTPLPVSASVDDDALSTSFCLQ